MESSVKRLRPQMGLSMQLMKENDNISSNIDPPRPIRQTRGRPSLIQTSYIKEEEEVESIRTPIKKKKRFSLISSLSQTNIQNKKKRTSIFNLKSIFGTIEK
ncbi:hypothetical protein SNEBB_005881, partial [Seison nebaliae]